jgi:GNAT superfamily N-acetyltransferase
MKIVVLTESVTLDFFDCGDPVRNNWLKSRANSNAQTDDTRTYLAIETNEPIGFYAITTGSILRATLPGSLRRNAPDPVSCVLLAQLAVALSHQGQGISRTLMIHAMTQAVTVSDIAGSRLLIVHPATPRLVTYYGNFGFIEIETTPVSIMVMTIQKTRSLLTAL